MDEPRDSPGLEPDPHPPERRLRLVCHGCGARNPIDTVPFCVEHQPGCGGPSHIHVHNVSRPCDWCRDDGEPVATKALEGRDAWGDRIVEGPRVPWAMRMAEGGAMLDLRGDNPPAPRAFRRRP